MTRPTAAAAIGVLLLAAPAGAAPLLQTLADTPGFTQFTRIVERAGLAERLAGPGPFTVFAPTDDAFAAMPEASRELLLAPANAERLRAVLAYHIVPLRLTADDLHNGVVNTYPTLNGAPMVAHDTRNGVQIDDVTVKRANITADNGVIHGVDRIIMPPEVATKP